MDTLWKSRVGEAAVAQHLVESGHDIYMPTFGNARYDMVTSKGTEVKTVQVKTSEKQVPSGAYEFQLRSVRPNRSNNRIVPFDAEGVDVLALYVMPTGKVVLLDAKDYHGRSTITIKG